jgi:hypothetical protein
MTISRKLPISGQLCPGCGTLMAQALVDAGETHHVTCGPDRPSLKIIKPEPWPEERDDPDAHYHHHGHDCDGQPLSSGEACPYPEPRP